MKIFGPGRFNTDVHRSKMEASGQLELKSRVFTYSLALLPPIILIKEFSANGHRPIDLETPSSVSSNLCSKSDIFGF
jgi:hypothetical protein